MPKELTESYMPEKLLHRDEQISEIRNVFQMFKKYGTAKNILIQGFSGSGKTACINKVLNEQINHFIYVSGSKQITSTQILKAITDLTFNTRERLLSEAIREFRKNPKIIVIDEINKLKRTEEVRWLFNDLNTLFRETQCPIILITNRRELLKIPDQDALRTLFFRIIDFKPYDAQQIKEIVEDRINLINTKYEKKVGIPEDKKEGFLNHISALATNKASGSARLALLLCRECIISEDFSPEKVQEIMETMEESEWQNLYEDLPHTEKRFLALLYGLSPKMKEIPISEIVKAVKDYPPSRITQLIDSLEKYFIIERVKNIKDKRKTSIKFISEDVLKRIGPLTESTIPL